MAEIENNHMKNLFNIAYIITKDKTWKIIINNNNSMRTAYIIYDYHEITLTNQLFPIGMDKYPSLYLKLYDGELVHELGHEQITKPHNERYQTAILTKTYQKLAKNIKNIIEDKRVNYYMIQKYRLDYGLRLDFLMRIIRDSTEATLKQPEQIARQLYYKERDFSAYFMNLIVRKGLYGANIDSEVKALTNEQQTDLTEILNLLESAKWKRVTHDLIVIFERFYKIVSKYVKDQNNDNHIDDRIPKNNGGKMDISLSDETQEVKEEKEKQEKQTKDMDSKEKDEKELKEKVKKYLEELKEKKVTTGSEIPAPTSNHAEYNRLVAENQKQITELLNKLKQIVKPTFKRALLQRKGKLINAIVPKMYAESYRHPIENIYASQETIYKKQKVAINFSFDSSGSVNRDTLMRIMTILNESFGQYVQDNEYAINNFATNLQRIKTFFEAYDTTKARIPNMYCGSDNNIMVVRLLESVLRQFNSITNDYKKICCIISDFALLIPESAFNEIINKLIDSKVTVIFIGIDSWKSHINDYMADDKRVKRVGVNNMDELPNLFIKIYLEAIGVIQTSV